MKVMIWLKDRNWEHDVTEICPYKFKELVDGRVFENLKDCQYTLMALGRSKYSMEHGMSCPADVRRAIKKVENLEKYK